MTLRDHCNEEELAAHYILDLAKTGAKEMPDSVIAWALIVLGDGVGMGLRNA